jgi:hypothetical protein
MNYVTAFFDCDNMFTFFCSRVAWCLLLFVSFNVWRNFDCQIFRAKRSGDERAKVNYDQYVHISDTLETGELYNVPQK